MTAAAGYLSGFGNEFATEAIDGALPVGRNSPQRAPLGLYAEQLSGTAFTAPRAQNRRTWQYRIRPSAMHGSFTGYDQRRFHNDFGGGPVTPDQLRWDPLPMPAEETAVDFVDGCTPWPATAVPRQAPASACTCMPRTVQCRGGSSMTPTANC